MLPHVLECVNECVSLCVSVCLCVFVSVLPGPAGASLTGEMRLHAPTHRGRERRLTQIFGRTNDQCRNMLPSIMFKCIIHVIGSNFVTVIHLFFVIRHTCVYSRCVFNLDRVPVLIP